MEEEGIKIKSIIEIMGAPKEHVENTLSMIVKKVKENKEINVISDKINPTIEVEGKPFWSCFCEFELEFKDVDGMVGFCFDYMPSSMEIISPQKFSLEGKNVEGMLNDLLARLHEYDMMLKNIHAQNIILKKELEKIKPAEKKE